MTVTAVFCPAIPSIRYRSKSSSTIQMPDMTVSRDELPNRKLLTNGRFRATQSVAPARPRGPFMTHFGQREGDTAADNMGASRFQRDSAFSSIP